MRSGDLDLSESPKESGGIPRKNWSREVMEKAVQDVQNGILGLRRAALEYNVPRSTLSDYVQQKSHFGATSGPAKYLSSEEEEEVVKWIAGCAEIGWAKSVREIRGVVSTIVSSKLGYAVNVSQGWWDKFRKRHPQLVLRSSEMIAYKRAVAVNKDVIDHYFDLLECTLKKNGLSERAPQIFNADESGMPLSPQAGKRVGLKGTKRVYCVSSGVKTQITVLCCASASGYAIPPLVIFKRKNMAASLTTGQIAGTSYGLNPKSGWIDGDIFRDWFLRHFLLHAPAVRPLLLLLDGHSSHFEPNFIREAAGQGVIVFCLPPNTTHVCQPLDSTCFHSLKAHWGNVCSEYLAANPGKVITVYQFSSLFASAFTRAFTPQNIISSFRMTGVFPPNRRAIPIPGYGESAKASLTPTAQVAKAKGIRYLPLYTPSKSDNSPPFHTPSRSDKSSKNDLSFTDKELQLFSRRFDEGYDMTTDERYNEWMRVYHFQNPTQSSLASLGSSFKGLNLSQDLSDISNKDSASPDTSPVTVNFQSKISEFLVIPTPPARRPEAKTCGKAKVISGVDYLELMDKKEAEKRQKQAEKQEKRVQAELKRKEREEKKALKALEKANKKKAKGIIMFWL